MRAYLPLSGSSDQESFFEEIFFFKNALKKGIENFFKDD